MIRWRNFQAPSILKLQTKLDATLFLGDTIYHTYTATLTGERELKDLVSWLSGKAYARIDWIVRSDYTKATKTFDNFRQDLQCSVGVTVSL